ncbi:putative P-loop containing nucleoside triphosphate hydrolase, leucine-rich repeat domain superfamily [Helianthus anomalus]
MQIVENWQGLPLAVVVIAGVLAKEACSEKLWEEISYKTGSYLVGDQNGCLEILASSYNHLPLHLRECFLYLGGLPEDYEFEFDGGVKACKVHDLVKELCLKKAKEEGFILQRERLILSSELSNVTAPPCKPIRMFINEDINNLGFSYRSVQNNRSILWFSDFRSSSDDIARYFSSFVLLRVLSLQTCELKYFPNSMKMLVHLRYLAIQNSSEDFQSSICDLWNLQTLIYLSSCDTVLPRNISDLVSLRHLSYNPSKSGWLYLKNIFFFLPSIDKPMKLQTISHVVLGEGVDNFQKCFPYIKELKCRTYTEKENDFQSLTYLEKLKCIGTWDSRMHGGPKGEPSYRNNHITFPETLKTLTLKCCALPWSDMSIIQSLPNLQVLKLKEMPLWEAAGRQMNKSFDS